jgi:3-oxoacyl-[acyl-carrier-protein] synthase-3
LVENYDAAKGSGNLDSWIRTHYGIEERRWSDELPSYQAILACEKALEASNTNIDEVDFLILNTAFGDMQQPTTATEVQKGLGMRPDTFAMELNSPCAGSVLGLVTAMHFLNSGQHQKALVVGVDKMTKLVDLKDFRMAGLFGEGAGACLLKSGREEETNVHYLLGSKGEIGEPDEFSLRVLGGKARFPHSKYKHVDDMFYLQMHGQQVKLFVEEVFKETIAKLLSKSGLNQSDVDYIVTHQASENMVVKALSNAGMDPQKAIFTIREYGNTSAASILITLDKLFKEKGVVKGDQLLLLGMGGGLNWGGILYQHT